jgi:hypothetical protein
MDTGMAKREKEHRALLCAILLHLTVLPVGWEQIEVGECLLSFGARSSVFQFAIQKYKD